MFNNKTILNETFSNNTDISKQSFIELKDISRKNNGTYICFADDTLSKKFELLVICKKTLILIKINLKC
jgi:hypothetical protein